MNFHGFLSNSNIIKSVKCHDFGMIPVKILRISIDISISMLTIINACCTHILYITFI